MLTDITTSIYLSTVWYKYREIQQAVSRTERKGTKSVAVCWLFINWDSTKFQIYDILKKKLLNYSSVRRQLRSKLRSKRKLGPEGEQLVLSLRVRFGSKTPSEQREPAAKAASESSLGASDKDGLMGGVRWVYAGYHHVAAASCISPGFGKNLSWLYCTLELLQEMVAASDTGQQPCAALPIYDKINLKLKERCYSQHISPWLGVWAEDGVWVTEWSYAPASDSLYIKQKSTLHTQRVFGLVNTGKFHKQLLKFSPR